MSGQLFTQYFLAEGIRATPHWKRSAAGPGAFTAFCETARRILKAFGGAKNLNEADLGELTRPARDDELRVFHLYGLSREAASYVLDTFPIVRRDDEKTFGRYRTRDLILAYMNALEAGDTETRVAR